jgi:hypothetical protein
MAWMEAEERERMKQEEEERERAKEEKWVDEVMAV